MSLSPLLAHVFDALAAALVAGTAVSYALRLHGFAIAI
jgi:hypothetical protein